MPCCAIRERSGVPLVQRRWTGEQCPVRSTSNHRSTDLATALTLAGGLPVRAKYNSESDKGGTSRRMGEARRPPDQPTTGGLPHRPSVLPHIVTACGRSNHVDRNLPKRACRRAASSLYSSQRKRFHTMARRIFSLPKFSAWRPEMMSSDWAFYGLTYAGIFFTFTTVGIAAMKIIGPSPEAEERRKNQRPMRQVFDLQGVWNDVTRR